jgi:hypothetical protein
MYNPDFTYDIWDVKKAAQQLQGHAFAVSARHLKFPGTAFYWEIAQYAKHIIKEVEGRT